MAIKLFTVIRGPPFTFWLGIEFSKEHKDEVRLRDLLNQLSSTLEPSNIDLKVVGRIFQDYWDQAAHQLPAASFQLPISPNIANEVDRLKQSEETYLTLHPRSDPWIFGPLPRSILKRIEDPSAFANSSILDFGIGYVAQLHHLASIDSP